MKISLILISVFAMVTMVLGGCAHRFKTPEQRADHFVTIITKKLDLNDEQKANLNTLRDEMLAVREGLEDKRDEKRDIVQSLLAEPVLDQDKATTLINGHFNDISSQSPRIVAALANFWDSLTPKQQIKIREKVEKHSDRKGCWRHGYPHYM
ncbi:MAG: Spy/CpxP family protein refolding chaperone [Chromatiales bacterium]|nr:Spy/CpxP family protein refolding chaperone [Chromatiales bacterium]